MGVCNICSSRTIANDGEIFLLCLCTQRALHIDISFGPWNSLFDQVKSWSKTRQAFLKICSNFLPGFAFLRFCAMFFVRVCSFCKSAPCFLSEFDFFNNKSQISPQPRMQTDRWAYIHVRVAKTSTMSYMTVCFHTRGKNPKLIITFGVDHVCF